jgi:hypothetical protein
MKGMIRTMVLLEDGSSRMVTMTVDMIGKLAKTISETGIEHMRIASQEVLTVVGFMVIGKKTGERVIVLPKAPESTESPSDSGSRIEGSGGSYE